MKIISFVFTILLLSGCTNSSPKVKEFFQTDNATHIQNDYKEIISLLIQYKKKLDLRNPQSYDKQFSYHIYNELNKRINEYKPIIIGDYVWIGCRSLILIF